MAQDERPRAEAPAPARRTPSGDAPASGRAGGRATLAELAALLRQNLRLVVFLVCVATFLALLGEVLEGELMRLDRVAYLLFVVRLRAPWLTPVMEGFSALATPVALVVLLLVVAAFAPGRAPGWCCAANLVLVVGLNQLLKFLVQRPRPTGFRLAEAAGFSFPSGHSMVAMAFFGLLAWLVWRYERDRRMRAVLVAAFGLVTVMVGVSRVYLGVHYASDVIAGFCLSLAWLALYTRVAVPLFLRDRPALVAEPPRDGAPRGV